MRFSLITLAGLAALTGKLGVHARALPQDLATSSYSDSLDTTNLEQIENEKRSGITLSNAAAVEVRETKRGLFDKKPSTKPATKPVTKPATKPATQPATKPATKPAVKPAVQPGTSKPATSRLAKNGVPKRFCQLRKGAKKGGSTRRPAKRTLADTENAEKVYTWLKANGNPNNILFYSDSVGYNMVLAFQKKNKGYQSYHTIFSNPKFFTDMGTTMEESMRSGMKSKAGMEARSLALGRFAKNPFVFNAAQAHEDGMLQRELREMKSAGTVTFLEDNATSPSQVDFTLTGAEVSQNPTVAPNEC